MSLSPPELTVLQTISVHEHARAIEYWDRLVSQGIISHHVSGTAHFVCCKQPDRWFKIDKMRAHRLIQSADSTPIISPVCDRLNARCLYLESADPPSLQYLLWDCRRSDLAPLPPAA